MEHRHDREHRVALAYPETVGLVGEEHVQHGRAVRVDDALGRAGRAARVTHGGGGALVDVGEDEAGVAGLDQILVGERALPGSFGVGHHDLVLDAVEARHLAGERRIEEDDPVLGVIDDVAEVLLEQADVERVEHRAHRGHGEVQLEVAEGVPAERGDPVAGADAELVQRRGETARARHNVAVGASLDAGRGDAHHLAPAEQPLSAFGD